MLCNIVFVYGLGYPLDCLFIFLYLLGEMKWSIVTEVGNISATEIL